MTTHQYTDDRYYRTSSFYLAAFLFAKNAELVNIDRSDEKRSQFVFVDNPELETMVSEFNYGRDGSLGALVDVRRLVFAIKSLKEKLYNGIL